MAKCVVSGCPNRVTLVNANLNRGVLSRPPKRFFSFPKDPAQVKVWLAALRETDKQDLTEQRLICEDHFLPEDVSADGVKSGAIPIMPPCLDGSLGMINPWGAESSEEEDKGGTGGDDGDDDAFEGGDDPVNVEADDPPQQDAGTKKTSAAKTTGASLQREKIQTKGGLRQGASLGVLTLSFLGLMQAAPGCLLDLNCVTMSLKTRRRRVYDITNILEGMLLIKKESANMYKWTGKTPISSFLQTNKQKLETELENLKVGEDMLDSLIKSCTQQLFETTDDKENAALAYLTYEDVSRFSAFQEQTVIVVKAPADTTLEVPAPKEGGIQVHIKGGLGPIKVLACDTGTGDVTGENSGCFLTLEESRIKTHSLYEESRSPQSAVQSA